MVNPILLPELREMLQTDDHAALAEFCETLHPATAAEFMEGLDVDQTWAVFTNTDLQRQAAIFQYFPLSKQIDMAGGIGRERMSRLIEEMAPDDRVNLLQHLDGEMVENLLPLVAQAERNDIRRLLSSAEDSAGSVMTTEYAWLPEDITASDALARLRLQAPDRETIYYVYVLDSDRRLKGLVSLRQLIMARPTTRVGDLMERDVITVRVSDDKEEVARKLARYDFLAMPVVDDEGRLVGIVTHDDVIDVVVEEATEDVHRLGGMEPLEQSYLESPFWTLTWKRGIWLALLFLTGLVTSSVLQTWHGIVEGLGLYVFLTLVVASGGNCGSQSATLITRSLALGQVTLRDWARVLARESLSGLVLGLFLGLLGFIRAWWVPVKTEHVLAVAFIVAGSLLFVTLCGTLLGSLLPLLLKRLGGDPAITSNPFVASLVDVIGSALLIFMAYLIMTCFGMTL